MTATQADLAEAFRRLVAGLSWLEDQPDGPERAKHIRHNLTLHLGQLSDSLAGKAAKCEKHPTKLAEFCGPCRSERIGVEPGAPRPLPAQDPDVRALQDRILGEHPTESENTE